MKLLAITVFLLLASAPAWAADTTPLATIAKFEASGDSPPSIPASVIASIGAAGPEAPGWPGGDPPTDFRSGGIIDPSIPALPPSPSSVTPEGGAAPVSVAVSSQGGVLDRPFSWAYAQLITSMRGHVEAQIGRTRDMVQTYLSPLLVLAAIALAIRAFFANAEASALLRFILHLCVVVPLLAVGSVWYHDYVFAPVMDFPSWWQTYIINSIGYTIVDPGNPGSLLDRVYLDTGVVGERIWQATPWGIHSIYIALQLVGARFVCIASLCGLFLPQAILSLLSMIALMIGMLFLPCLMFHASAAIFWAWVWTVVSLLVSKLAIDIVIGMFSAAMVNLLAAITVTGTPNTDIPGFWGAAIVMVLMGFSVRYVPSLIHNIAGRVTVGMEGAARQMSAGPMRDAVTSAAAAMGGAATRGLARGLA